MLNKKALIGTLMLAGSLSALAQSSIILPIHDMDWENCLTEVLPIMPLWEELAMRSEIADISIC